ncbi:MAG: hypothetical protein ACTHJL_08815 [Amnibacterium sp.]
MSQPGSPRSAVETFVRADPERVRLLAHDPEAQRRWDLLAAARGGRDAWRIVPVPGGVRVVTAAGELPDRGLLKPIVLWATAWSLDRLRIWSEAGTPPEQWPLRSVLSVHRPRRPRARRCVVGAAAEPLQTPLTLAHR